MAEELLLTQEGYDKIVAEHEELVSVRRKEISEKLKEAISYGDLSENAEYDAAKNEQAELEERIFKLEDMMKKAKIINEEEMTNDFVGVGSKVLVKDLDNGDEMTLSKLLFLTEPFTTRSKRSADKTREEENRK